MTESRANAPIPSPGPRDGVAVTQPDKKQASTHVSEVQEDKAQNDDDGERGGTLDLG